MARVPWRALLLVVVAATGVVVGCDDGPTGPTVCTLSLAPSERTFAAEGGTGTVAVTASDASCGWTATPGASWVAVTTGASGRGSGSVTYAVVANPDAAMRTTTVAVDGQSHAVTREGLPAPPCSYALSPSNTTLGHAGGTGSFGVFAPPQCGWTALSGEPWVAITGAGGGAGDGTVMFSVAENNSTISRTAAITVADQLFSIVQAGEQPACTFSIAPASFTPCMPGGQFSTTITASAASCAWTVSTSAPWLTLVTGGSGQGTSDIRFGVSSNYDAPRSGIVMVRWDSPTLGQNVQVQQAGCLYAVTQASFSFPAAGGPGSFDVLQQSDPINCGGPLQNACVWSAVADVPWIVVSSGLPHQGDDRVSFTVQSNSTGMMRTGTITVRDKVVQITQGG